MHVVLPSIPRRYYRFMRLRSLERLKTRSLRKFLSQGLAKGAINSDLRSRYALCVVPIYQPVLSLVAKQRLYAYLTSARVGILRGTPTG